jgi:hypothetical protein
MEITHREDRSQGLQNIIRLYSLFKSERLNADIKLTLHKALFRSVITYAFAAWEFTAESCLLKLQRLKNKAFRAIGSFPRGTSVRDMHMAFRIPYFYDYITKSCRQQAEGIQNHENENFAILDKAKPDKGNTKLLNLAAIMFTTVQV